MMGLQTENLILKKEIVQGKGIALKAHILKNNCRTGFKIWPVIKVIQQKDLVMNCKSLYVVALFDLL